MIGLAAATAAYAAVHRLGATYGSTKQERRTGLPGDDIVRRPQFTVTHAITIDVPSEQVWPWLVPEYAVPLPLARSSRPLVGCHRLLATSDPGGFRDVSRHAARRQVPRKRRLASNRAPFMR